MASSSGCAPRAAAQSCHAAAGKDASVSPSEVSGTASSFPRHHRLTARRQFLDVYDKGWRVHRSAFTIFGAPNHESSSRLGITVTRKVGNAVARNRAKRLLREAFRRRGQTCSPPMDIVINGKGALVSLKASAVEQALADAMAELGARIRR